MHYMRVMQKKMGSFLLVFLMNAITHIEFLLNDFTFSFLFTDSFFMPFSCAFSLFSSITSCIKTAIGIFN